MKGKFYKKSNIGAVSKLFICAGIAMGAILIFTLVFSSVALLFEDVSAVIPGFAIATVVVSAIVGGAVVTRTIGEGRLSLALLSSLMASLIFMLVGVIIGGKLPFSVFMNFIIFVGAFTLSAYLLRKREKFGGGHRR